MLLEYSGVSFEDKKYNAYSGGNGRAEWAKDKHSLGFAFPNLPYLIDGDVKLTQSHAIIRYLARKHGLVATKEEEIIAMELTEFEIEDFKNNFVELCYGSGYEENKVNYEKNLPHSLAKLENFLGNKTWWAGEKLTYVDFMVFETLDQHTIFSATCLDNFPHLKAFVKRFSELPKIEAYLKSDRCLKRPCNNPSPSGL